MYATVADPSSTHPLATPRQAIRKTLEERYLDQSGAASKSERKSQGAAYFYKKLRF